MSDMTPEEFVDWLMNAFDAHEDLEVIRSALQDYHNKERQEG